MLSELHGPGHRGIKSMYMMCLNKYTGFKREQIEKYVGGCAAFQREKLIDRVESIRPIVSEGPWQHVQADLIDLHNFTEENDGFSYILNIVDLYSRFWFSFLLKGKTADEIGKHFKKLFLTEGAPLKLQTDNGKEFCNETLRGICNSFSIVFAHGRPRHPQSQGQIERLNQTIVRSLSRALSKKPKRWIDHLDEVVYQYNTSWHRATNSNAMALFRKRLGFSGMANHVTVAANESAEGISEDDAEYLVADFDSEQESDVIQLEEPSVNVEADLSAVNYGENDTVDYDTMDYGHRYRERMVVDSDVHRTSPRTFNPGDHVLIAVENDNNTKIRKRKFGEKFEDDVWVVVARSGRHNVVIQLGDETKTIAKKLIKKFIEPWPPLNSP